MNAHHTFRFAALLMVISSSLCYDYTVNGVVETDDDGNKCFKGRNGKCGCIDSTAMVMMANGSAKAAGKVQVGDLVRSPNAPNGIAAVTATGINQMLPTPW